MQYNNNNNNIKKRNIQFAETHETKLSNFYDLLQMMSLILSPYKLSHFEANIIKYGLRNSIPRKYLPEYMFLLTLI